MDRKKIKKLQELLIKEKEKLLRGKTHIEEILKKSPKEATGELSTYRTHIADLGSDTYQKEIAAYLTTQETQILMKIDKALRKIEEGIYGKCEKCNKEIDEGRLEAIPYAELCIDCQRELEKRQKK
ncbi:MAG: TraR/DksA family transcriptional regulator [candidate division WOR-3 bacterium]|uniref:Zinc finger DksA/TraR C4-type domain-containing protein n=1 Tax=candidate division WOR-3 bacterium TaxID=2052148 RepID=A0A7V4CHS7_UNCW3